MLTLITGRIGTSHTLKVKILSQMQEQFADFTFSKSIPELEVLDNICIRGAI